MQEYSILTPEEETPLVLDYTSFIDTVRSSFTNRLSTLESNNALAEAYVETKK
jgi:hypothetical protein